MPRGGKGLYTGVIAFQAGHAGSIPVTAPRKNCSSDGLSAQLEKVWRTLRKAPYDPVRPLFSVAWVMNGSRRSADQSLQVWVKTMISSC